MAIKRITSGGIFENKIGYCRAVVAGGFIHISGTTAQGDQIPSNVEGQCRSALQTIEATLIKAGATMADVIKVTYMLPSRNDFEACWPILSDAFGENPPAATMIECNLIDPKYLIEIEVTALAK